MAASLDERMAIADVYADALYALAREADTVNEVRAELEELVKLLELEPDFRTFLTSGAIDDDRRMASLEKMFRGQLSDLVLNTLLVMVRHERGGVLPSLLRCFVLNVEEARKQVEVKATTAVELNEGQRAEIVTLAQSLSGREPLVEYVVDESLLGGLVLQIGDWRFDNSLRRQLRQMRAQLFDRAERGLAVGMAD